MNARVCERYICDDFLFLPLSQNFFFLGLFPKREKSGKKSKKKESILKNIWHKHTRTESKHARIYHESSAQRDELHVRAVRVVQSVDVGGTRRRREMVRDSFYVSLRRIQKFRHPSN